MATRMKPRNCPDWRPAGEPAGEHLGLELLLTEARGFARVAYHARAEFLNALGSVQGGFLAAMLDQAMVEAAIAAVPAPAALPTLELKTSFLRPAPPRRLIGEGRLLHQSRTVMFLEGRILTPDGMLLATGSQTALIRPLPASASSA
jgi:uncharacterized protein (TIGR00369 family)